MTECGDNRANAWHRPWCRLRAPEEEVVDTLRLLRGFGVPGWDHSTRILEILCKRGCGLAALERLGFYDLTGIDPSREMLGLYRGGAAVRVGSPCELPFESGTFDAVMVCDGLHRLRIANELNETLAEVNRVLTPDGCFLCVEPWLTPSRRLLHFACAMPSARRMSLRLRERADLLAAEGPAYDHWLASPNVVMTALRRFFVPEVLRIGRGRLRFLGRWQEVV